MPRMTFFIVLAWSLLAEASCRRLPLQSLSKTVQRSVKVARGRVAHGQVGEPERAPCCASCRNDSDARLKPKNIDMNTGSCAEGEHEDEVRFDVDAFANNAPICRW